MVRKRLLTILLVVSMLTTFMPSMTFAASNSKLTLKAKATSASTVKLSWNKVKKATKYVVYGKQKGKSYKKLATLNKSKKSYTVKKYSGKKLIAGKKYTFYAVAYKGTKKLTKSKNVTVKTKKQENDKTTYTLTYNSNGGSGSMSQQTFLSGETVIIAANSFTAPNGKEFSKWNTTANGTGTSYNAGVPVGFTGNTTLYAQWKDAHEEETGGNGGNGGGPSKPTKTANVAKQEELTVALADPENGTINIDTSADTNFTISKGDYSNVTLNVNAPNGHIENAGTFEKVNIQEISKSTWVEKAKGNSISYSASNGRISVSSDARCSIEVKGDADNLELVSDGTVSSLIINVKVNIVITGNPENYSPIPTTVGSGAGSSEITTELNLNLNTKAKCNVIVGEGAEDTAVIAQNDECIPELSGLGRIEVKVETTGEINYVVCETNVKIAEKVTTKINISGYVLQDLSSCAAVDTKVYVIPYSENVDECSEASNVASANASADGSYSINNIPIGNYILLFKCEGFMTVLKTLVLTKDTSTNYKVEDTRIIPAGGGGGGGGTAPPNGSLSGTIKNAVTDDPIKEAGITVQLRKGQNNMSGTPYRTTYTDEDGDYSFEDVDYGYYTVTVVDERIDADNSYLSVAVPAIVSRPKTTLDISLTGQLDDNAVRFVLTWGSERTGASPDIDSHLVGPKVDGNGKFHTWYSDKVYGEEYYDEYDDEYYYVDGKKYADLDLDDVEWEGPETTTIYQNTKGIYTFYVHDFTNRLESNTSQLSRSDAVVKVYVGERLRATYIVPSGAGNLWTVCEYNSATNRFTEIGEMGYWPIDEEYIGMGSGELLDTFKSILRDLIDEVADEKDYYTSTEFKNYIQAEINSATLTLNNSNDMDELVQAINDLRDIFNIFDIDEVSMLNASGEDILEDWYTDWEYDDDTDDEYSVLTLETMEDSYSSLTVTPRLEGAQATIRDTSDYGYTKKLTLSFKGESRTYYIKIEKPEWIIFGIDNISMKDVYDTELIDDWGTEWEYDEDTDDDYRVLYLYTDDEPINETLTVTPSYSNTTASIQNTSEHGCSKKLVMSYGGETREYFIVVE